MEKQRKYVKIILLFVFCLLCINSLLGVMPQNSKVKQEAENRENRELATKPKFTFHNYNNYFSEYNIYFDDNFPFRNKWIYLNNLIDYKIFGKSSNADVIIGNEGWLFGLYTLADYEKSNLYDEEELEVLLADLLVTQQYFDERGIEFIFYVAPNKNTIYSEYMPGKEGVPKGPSRTEQAIQYIRENSDITVIYPKEEVLQAKAAYPDLQLYFKIDTHWNYMGAYWGTKPLLEKMGVKTEPFEQVTWEEINEPVLRWHGYDLAEMLGISEHLSVDTNYHLSGYTKNEVSSDGEAALIMSDFYGDERNYSNSKDKRKVYFARDSFGVSMLPFLSAEFGEVYSVHKDKLDAKTIDEESPDIFIYEVVERNSFGLINVNHWKPELWLK